MIARRIEIELDEDEGQGEEEGEEEEEEEEIMLVDPVPRPSSHRVVRYRDSRVVL